MEYICEKCPDNPCVLIFLMAGDDMPSECPWGMLTSAKWVKRVPAQPADRYDPVCSDCGDPLTTGELICFACVEIGSITRLLKKIDALLEICK